MCRSHTKREVKNKGQDSFIAYLDLYIDHSMSGLIDC